MTDDVRLTIENERIRLSVLPSFGARIVEFVDKRTNRNWLVTGAPIGSTSDDAIFGKDEAVGWDECFPTIAATEIIGAQRDHGALWGRPQKCTVHDCEITTEFVAAGYLLDRVLALRGEVLVAKYRLRTSNGSIAIPALWSQHCLLDVAPGEQININGLADPNPAFLREIAPLTVLDPNAGLSQKTYSRACEKPRVEISGANGKLSLSWNADEMPFCGIWINYGGWPEDTPCHQIAFEPATETGECPSQSSDILNGNIERCWTLTMSVSD